MKPIGLRDELRWRAIGLGRKILGQRIARTEWNALCAWRGLVHQAYQARPLQPNLCSDLWHQGNFKDPHNTKAFFTPNRREREPSSHHYGHDLQLKRFAGLPLVGPPLPVLLEHGLKVARSSRFERPKPWARCGYLCMGALRAQWLREEYGVPAHAIGPWIRFAQPLLTSEQIDAQRQLWGKTLLVVLAHSWDQVERSMDLDACISAVMAIAEEQNYQQVVWLRHWKDPEDLPLPNGWVKACNGHRSNPWFLDAMRTLLEISDGLASNAFGTHLGYGAALGNTLHWIDVEPMQNLQHLRPEKAKEEEAEWSERKRLARELRQTLTQTAAEQRAAVQALLDPYWGLTEKPDPEAMARLLRS
tara:strand:+ start:487 stop:1566 length:1080 start_codon:yes stop_codon:yes gene_type:complete